MAARTPWATSSEKASSALATVRIAVNSFSGVSPFEHQAARAKPNHLYVIGMAFRSGQYHGSHMQAGLLQHSKHFEAVGAGHEKIENDNVRLVAAE